MVERDADRKAETPEAHPEGRGQRPREQGMSASNAAAKREQSYLKASSVMEAVVERENMARAYRRVVNNRGSAGVDKMPVDDLLAHLKTNWSRMKEELLQDKYRPKAVRVVEIEKPSGGMRTLGIPTVTDRLIQQALNQVLTPIFDPHFSESSYAFRPGRSAHDAVLQAQRQVAEGRRWVVDIDLEKFFDRVNHDMLMARVARRVEDKRALRLVRRFLQAGAMTGGLVETRKEGTPQGGPLSPLLSNILLDDLDKELERRGHAFCRYADDCNIYVRSKAAAERVMASVSMFLTRKLRLKVNADKSAVVRPWNSCFLGYSMTTNMKPKLKVAPASVRRLKKKLKKIFRIGRGRSIARLIEDLRPVLRGWIHYFRLAEVKGIFEELDGWIRRRLRVVIWRQWKRVYTRAKNLMKRGLTQERAWKSACNGRGPWYNAGASHMNDAFRKEFFRHFGLVSLQQEHRRLYKLS